MTFSIIVPAYNAEGYIGRTIESVRNQDFSDWELIVINNGSLDRTRQAIEKYGSLDTRIKLIDCARNSGSPAGARNLGLKAARGEYIAFLDADDSFFPNKLSEVFKFFREHPDIDLVCHGEEHLKNGKAIRRDYYGPYTRYEDLLLCGNTLSTSAVVIRKECIGKIGLFSEGSEFGGFEDYDYWLRAARVCRIGYLKSILGTYAVNENSESSRIALNCRNALSFLDKQFRQYGRRSAYRLFLMSRRKAMCLRSAGREFMKMRDYKNALFYLARAIAHNPCDPKQLVFFITALLSTILRKHNGCMQEDPS